MTLILMHINIISEFTNKLLHDHESETKNEKVPRELGFSFFIRLRL